MKGKEISKILANDTKLAPYYRGVYHTCDISIAPLIDLNSFNIFVFNIKSGHWVALIIGSDRSWYVDPLAQTPPDELLPSIERWAQPLTRLPATPIQSLKSIFCGYFTLYFIDHICLGARLLPFSTSNLKQNDNLVRNFISKRWPRL